MYTTMVVAGWKDDIVIVVVKQILQFYLTIAIPGFYLLLLVIINNTAHTFYDHVLIVTSGMVLSAVGLIMWLFSYKHLGSSFGVLPKKQKRTYRGIYQLVPHPMYIGITLTFIGLGLSFRSYPGLILTLVLLIPLLIIRAVAEDRKLVK